MNFIRAYLRASTQEQDANRARDALDTFVFGQGGVIASYYVENESGASLDRPELFRLLNDCRPGDVLLTEQVDRLSRLSTPDWEILRTEIKSRRVRVVALDLPTSWGALKANLDSDDFTSRMFEAINSMLLDMLAAVARKDYEDRRRRQARLRSRFHDEFPSTRAAAASRHLSGTSGCAQAPIQGRFIQRGDLLRDH